LQTSAVALQGMAAEPRLALGVVRVACGDYHLFLRLSNLGLGGDPRWLVDGEMVLDDDYEPEIQRIEPVARAERFPPRPSPDHWCRRSGDPRRVCAANCRATFGGLGCEPASRIASASSSSPARGTTSARNRHGSLSSGGSAGCSLRHSLPRFPMAIRSSPILRQPRETGARSDPRTPIGGPPPAPFPRKWPGMGLAARSFQEVRHEQ
jgi:hypothetical protein